MTFRDAILILDPERAVIEEASPFMAQLLGYEQDELVGRSFRDLDFLGDQEVGASLFEQVRREGYVFRDSVPLRIRDDVCVLAELVGISYLVNDRKVIQFTFRGVSEGSGDDEVGPQPDAEHKSP